MPRVTKEVAQRMIHFAKSVKLTANFYDGRAASAFEFGRQISSPKLKKINPNFSYSFEVVDTNTPPTLVAEFADGSKWTTETTKYTCSDLRYQFFDRAASCEDKVDIVIPGEDEDGGAAGGKKGADKGKAGGKK